MRATFKTKLALLITFTLFAGIGCTKESPAANSNPSNDKSALLGTDSNQDGIRDDVETYIDKRTTNSEKKRTALRQFAADYQKVLSLMEDESKAVEASKTLNSSLWCVDDMFSDETDDEVIALKAEFANTYERSVAAIKVRTIRDKARYLYGNPSAKGSEKFKYCRFKPEALAN